ncbi:MAG: glycosyltransferase family 39 protein [Lachnospiraceae bacterium]|nr:glycosyltransferase family 39 protein [Lachnospiraceae bacterium]
MIVLFSLIKVNKGIDLTDTGYSLGNYKFFNEGTGVWFLLTFVSNLAGYILTLLPFGGTMLGMKLYATLLVAVLGLLSYRFFLTKMPGWLAFLAEILAIGMCWAPTVILYNYMTYFFVTLGAIFLFRGLAGNRLKCLFLAGIFLGINLLVRFPGNGLEVFLIIPLIYYCIIHKDDSQDIVKRVLLCVGGYIVGFVCSLVLMMIVKGSESFMQMINGAFGIANSNQEYTFISMLVAILDAYWHGFKWALYMIICALLGVPFFVLYKDRFVKARKVFYCVCILFLFAVLERWGMFNFKYYQKESALQWGAIFLLLSIVVDIWIIVTKRMNHDWKLIGAISLVLILITPLGSNNYIWPVLNNLFFIAPVTFWVIYKFARWGREYLDATGKIPTFGFRSMAAAVTIAFLIQGIGVGCAYVFLDGEDGSSVNYRVSDNAVLAGMKTTEESADSLSELSAFISNNEATYENKRLVLYGDIPGLSFYLNKPSAINTTWSDLGSNPVEDMKVSIEAIDDANTNSRPLVIISRALYDTPDNSIKLDLINSFMEENSYAEVFKNSKFVVFE